MKLADLFVGDWSRVPLEAASLEEGLVEILQAVRADGLLSSSAVEGMARELATGEAGERVRINDDIVAVLVSLPELERPAVAVGIATNPLDVPPGGELPDEASGVLLLLTPGATTRARTEWVPPLQRILQQGGQSQRLLGARSVGQVRSLRFLMETDMTARDLVEDALVPVRYRVYPDTPLDEVLALIVRRGVRAVPVVGDHYEVLGILTLGDALGHLLKKGSPGAFVPSGEPAEREHLQARDVMTRSVLCVSEDQILVDAATMMVNRDVEQLPVVRDGELVGFLTRSSILRALYGHGIEPLDDDQESD